MATIQKIPRTWVLLVVPTVLIITTILFFSSLVFSFASLPFEARDPDEITITYSPELKYCLQVPSHPSPTVSVDIFANLFDKYSNISNATLSYSTIDGQQRGKEQMKLINGIPSNGTYRGTIPAFQNENVAVQYAIEVRDELNYSFSYNKIEVGFCPGIYYVTDLEILEVGLVEEPRENEPVVISAHIKDSDTGIESAKLYYRVEPLDGGKSFSTFGQVPPSNPVDYKMVEMREVDNQTYETTIPPVSSNGSIDYFIEAKDSEGNKDRSYIQGYLITGPNVDPPYCNEDANKISITSKVYDLDINDNTTNIQFRVSGYPIHKSLYFYQYSQPYQPYPPFYWEKRFFDHSLSIYAGYLQGMRIEDKDVKDIFGFALTQDYTLTRALHNECGSDYQSVRNANNTDSVSFPLSGDPREFPFDHYYINLMLDVPYRNITFDYTDENSNLFKTGFNYSSIIEDTTNLNLNKDCTIRKINQTWLCQKDLSDGSTIINVKYNFNRTYSIATVIIPIVAIFYLLGAIFLFDNSSENIGNRLALTLGIFALIFTLPNIINSLKPPTSAPTIADSMLSIIIIATIAFTISSILSSSSVLQKWFPKHYSLIDWIVFIIISGFVVSYFSNYLFDSELWWLIPLIIFGLGYGILLRALGVKISKPLLSIKKAKNM